MKNDTREIDNHSKQKIKPNLVKNETKEIDNNRIKDTSNIRSPSPIQIRSPSPMQKTVALDIPSNENDSPNNRLSKCIIIGGYKLILAYAKQATKASINKQHSKFHGKSQMAEAKSLSKSTFSIYQF